MLELKDLKRYLSEYTNIVKYPVEIEEKMEKIWNEEKIVLVAVCGETASGKTTLVKKLRRDFFTSAMSTDNYFCDISALIKKYGSFTKVVESGYPTDAPENFQLDVLRQDLIALKKGQPILMPEYSFPDGVSTPRKVAFCPRRIVFVEGICTFFEQVRDLFDLKIYLSIDKKLQWKRYQQRSSERGQDEKQIEKQFQMVSSAAEQYIFPNKKYADIIIEAKDEAIQPVQKARSTSLNPFIELRTTEHEQRN